MLEKYGHELHRDLATKVEELTNAVKVTTSAKEAGAATVSITPLKGESYATGIHALMGQIALGLGDEYSDTGAVPGSISRNKKGDGVLTINGGSARIVLDITNSILPFFIFYLFYSSRYLSSPPSLFLLL